MVTLLRACDYTRLYKSVLDTINSHFRTIYTEPPSLLKSPFQKVYGEENNWRMCFLAEVILTKQHMQVIPRDLPLYFNKNWSLNNRQGNFHNLDMGTFPQYQENFMGRAHVPQASHTKHFAYRYSRVLFYSGYQQFWRAWFWISEPITNPTTWKENNLSYHKEKHRTDRMKDRCTTGISMLIAFA